VCEVVRKIARLMAALARLPWLGTDGLRACLSGVGFAPISWVHEEGKNSTS
jgi:hypothetical protein